MTAHRITRIAHACVIYRSQLKDQLDQEDWDRLHGFLVSYYKKQGTESWCAFGICDRPINAPCPWFIVAVPGADREPGNGDEHAGWPAAAAVHAAGRAAGDAGVSIAAEPVPLGSAVQGVHGDSRRLLALGSRTSPVTSTETPNAMNPYEVSEWRPFLCAPGRRIIFVLTLRLFL